MNYMSEVAKMLGVELGEEFYIKEQPDMKCTLYNDGLYVYPVADKICSLPSCAQTLHSLLTGQISIKRKPWKPNLDDMYYYVDELCCISSDPWVNDALDLMFYKLGNCYKTKKDAENDINKWKAFYASDEVLEV